MWNLRTGKEEPAFDLPDWDDEILLSPDGKLLLAYRTNSHLSIWDIAKKTERHRFSFTFEDGPFRWAFSDDSKLLVTSHGNYKVNDSATLRTWDLADGKKIAELRGELTASWIISSWHLEIDLLVICVYLCPSVVPS